MEHIHHTDVSLYLLDQGELNVLKDIHQILEVPHVAQQLLSSSHTPSPLMALPAFKVLVESWSCTVTMMTAWCHYTVHWILCDSGMWVLAFIMIFYTILLKHSIGRTTRRCILLCFLLLWTFCLSKPLLSLAKMLSCPASRLQPLLYAIDYRFTECDMWWRELTWGQVHLRMRHMTFTWDVHTCLGPIVMVPREIFWISIFMLPCASFARTRPSTVCRFLNLPTRLKSDCGANVAHPNNHFSRQLRNPICSTWSEIFFWVAMQPLSISWASTSGYHPKGALSLFIVCWIRGLRAPNPGDFLGHYLLS